MEKKHSNKKGDAIQSVIAYEVQHLKGEKSEDYVNQIGNNEYDNEKPTITLELQGHKDTFFEEDSLLQEDLCAIVNCKFDNSGNGKMARIITIH
ncbi:11802_t:CDS:2 [Diversispora eburnea]|uniref:11802_t:CDS:1 n=1 Tax=Diversispora eburnea TaxID=1213867 RepID=A0A9N8VIT0_9GLOM|nr:11802_t:CDS:2 [Diversispora eburnea]